MDNLTSGMYLIQLSPHCEPKSVQARFSCSNPNDAPDSNFEGYTFRLNKLDQFQGNFVNAEMVKAFTVVTEYGQRFAP
jgi:hypothetical protein